MAGRSTGRASSTHDSGWPVPDRFRPESRGRPKPASGRPASPRGNQEQERKNGSQPISRVLSEAGPRRARVETVICLGQRLPVASSGLPGSHHATGRRCSLFGLAPGGVCQAGKVTFAAGELLPRRFTLTSGTRLATDTGWRFVFCGTFPDLATGRRYRPPCPVEPGLSSHPCR